MLFFLRKLETINLKVTYVTIVPCIDIEMIRKGNVSYI